MKSRSVFCFGVYFFIGGRKLESGMQSRSQMNTFFFSCSGKSKIFYDASGKSKISRVPVSHGGVLHLSTLVLRPWFRHLCSLTPVLRNQTFSGTPFGRDHL